MGRQLSWSTVASYHISFTLHRKQEKTWERRDKKEEEMAGTRSKNLKRTRCVGFQKKTRHFFNDLIAVCLAVINCETIRQKLLARKYNESCVRKLFPGAPSHNDARIACTGLRAPKPNCLGLHCIKRAIPPNLELTEARFRSDTQCCLQAQWKLS